MRAHDVSWARAIERQRLRAHLRELIVPGLEELVDPGAETAELIALADRHARALRAELESFGDETPPVSRAPDAVERAREDERAWVRGHLHDTALQILEFIAGDGFGTGLSATKIAALAGGAARDLHRWCDADDAELALDLVAELERITAEARTLDPRVELVVGKIASPPTAEQVNALAGAVREAVTNARKHARASHVVVRVETAIDGTTAVTVTDDGIGIDPDRAVASSGLGVDVSIVGRMRRVGGNASLQCAPGGGTRVTLVTSRQENR